MRPASLALPLLLALAGALPAGAHEPGEHEVPASQSAVAEDPLAGRFGGPFTLVDQSGRTVTDRDFHGRFMLVTFGYTHCVDICPVDLVVHGAAIDGLGPDADKVVSVFVTVDPARDTPQVLSSWLQNVRPGTVGLSGSEEQVRRVARAYHVHRRKVPLDGPEAVHLRDSAGAYIVDHGSLAFLMRPDGRFATIIPHGIDTEKVTGILARYVRADAAADAAETGSTAASSDQGGHP